jgi:tetratricopeptide (TPR) repeat protein
MSAALADAAPRYNKTKEVEVRAEKRKAAPKRPILRPGPGLTVEAYRRQVRRKVARLARGAIAVLERLIRATTDGTLEKADYLFRRAEHYRELKTDASFRARELDERIFRARSAGERARLERRQRGHEAAEQRWMLEAMRTYLEIAKDDRYASYRRMDEVLFNVADMLNAAKRRDKALYFFRRLIRNYPKSRYIPDAYLSFAEHYFYEGKVAKALELYKRVGRFPDSPVHGYALYKQGWCWLNLKDPRQALEKFVQVIRHYAGKKTRIPLVREARKDVVRAYSDVGTPERAWSFFRRIGGKSALRMLDNLAALYYDQGKFLESILVHRKLMTLRPESPRVCDWQHAVLEATRSGKDKRQQTREIRRLANVYDKIRRLRSVPAARRSVCRQNTSDKLRELATTWHKECQKTRDMDTCRLARPLYEAYLERFSRDRPAYRMAYYLAELLYKLEQWKPAAEAYGRVVRMRPRRGQYLKDAAYAGVMSWMNANEVKDEPPAHPQGDHRTPMPIPPGPKRMLQAFATYLRHVPDSPERVTILYQKARTLYTYNHHERAVKAFSQLVRQYPKHQLAEYAVKLLLDSLNILDRKREIARRVARYLKNPHITARPSLKKHLEQLRLELTWERAGALRKAGRHRACGEVLSELANANQDHERWPKMLNDAASCFESAKLLGLAIQIRKKLIDAKPDHPLAHKAMLRIAQNYHGIAWFSRAAEYYERFARRFPGERDAPDALQNAIVFHMGRREHQRAVDAARRFVRNYGARPRHAARAAAVQFALGSIAGSRSETIQHYERYLRRWERRGGVDLKIRAHVKLGELLWREACPLQRTHDGICATVKRARSRRQLRGRRGRRHEPVLRERCGADTKARITLKRRRTATVREALRHLDKALQLAERAGHDPRLPKSLSPQRRKKRLGELRAAVAQARFQLAEARFERSLGVAFPEGLDFRPSNPRRAKRSRRRLKTYMEQKGKLLTETRQIYEEVIKLRVPHWAIAAAARIGQLYQTSADALYTAPIPKFDIPRQLRGHPSARREFLINVQDNYCRDIERYAIHAEDKAKQALGACLDRARDLSWYNKWSALCERELDQLEPGVGRMAAEIRARPGYVKQRADRAGLIVKLR